jgi:hypothetical protein
MEFFITTVVILGGIFICTVVIPIIIYKIYQYRYDINSYKNKVLLLNRLGYSKIKKIKLGDALTEKVDDDFFITRKQITYYRNNKHPNYPAIEKSDIKSMKALELLDYICDEIGPKYREDGNLISIYYEVLKSELDEMKK